MSAFDFVKGFTEKKKKRKNKMKDFFGLDLSYCMINKRNVYL